MSFVSVKFLLFILIVFIIYFLFPKKYRWTVLLGASIYFYIGVGIEAFLFLFSSAFTTYLAGIFLGKIRIQIESSKKESDGGKDKILRLEKLKKIVFLIAVLINFGILCYLKYFNFIIDNINSVLSIFTIDFSFSEKSLFLPLGLSFYTFQSMGYVIDVSRGKYKPETNFAKYSLFVSFFPQIVQGPISRYDQLGHQLIEGHEFDEKRIWDGLILMMWGYFKKLVIADRAAIFADEVFTNYAIHSGFETFAGLFFYGIQLYADFSGGIDITRSIAQIVGIDIEQNFQRPFFSRSVGEYWRRWHMTLGNWMRDYIYYSVPMARFVSKLSKKTKKVFGKHLGKVIPGSLATTFIFVIIGIWHDASWNYLAYGLCNGLIIGVSSLFQPYYKKIYKFFRINPDCDSWKLYQMIRTFIICMLLRVSHSGSLLVSITMLKSIFTDFNPWVLFDGSFMVNYGLTETDFHVLFFGCVVFFVISLMQEKGYRIREWIREQGIIFRWAVPIFLIFMTMMFAILDNNLVGGFLYAQF